MNRGLQGLKLPACIIVCEINHKMCFVGPGANKFHIHGGLKGPLDVFKGVPAQMLVRVRMARSLPETAQIGIATVVSNGIRVGGVILLVADVNLGDLGSWDTELMEVFG